MTGGAGFIGSNLVRMLLDDHCRDVVVLDDLSSGYALNVQDLAVRSITGDVADSAPIAEATRGCDTVFHLAASVGNKRSIDHPFEDARVNLMGTLNVLEAARRARVRKVVFSSSAGIFGELRRIPIRESHPVNPLTPYGVSKLAAEKLCLAYAHLYEIECVALRYFNVYGPHQRYDAYGNVIPIFVHRMLKGEPLLVYGDGEQTRDFVNVRDVAQANVKAALARGVSGAFNIASGTAVSINRLIELLGEAAGQRPEVQHVEPRPGDVRDSLASIAAARRRLGYRPVVGLAEGLVEYVDWARRAA